MAKKFMFNDPDTLGKMYSANEIGKILSIHSRTARKLILDGEIKSIKVGTRYKVPKSSLVDYIQQNSTEITNDK